MQIEEQIRVSLVSLKDGRHEIRVSYSNAQAESGIEMTMGIPAIKAHILMEKIAGEVLAHFPRSSD